MPLSWLGGGHGQVMRRTVQVAHRSQVQGLVGRPAILAPAFCGLGGVEAAHFPGRAMPTTGHARTQSLRRQRWADGLLKEAGPGADTASRKPRSDRRKSAGATATRAARGLLSA